MRSLRRTSILLAGTAGSLIAATSAAHALAQGPGYKAGPLIGTVYPKTGPKTPRPTPTPPAPPSHMGGTPGHMGGYPGSGGHGSAWHIGGMGHGWGAPPPGNNQGQPHGGGWHVGMGGYSHGGPHAGWSSVPKPMPGNGWSHSSGWSGGRVGWGGRLPLGVHPLGIHFYGIGGGSLAHSYGGGMHFAGGESWRSSYGAGGDLADRYGHLEHGYSPLLPPSNWGHGPLKPQPPHYAGSTHSGWPRPGGYTPGPVAWHPPAPPAPPPSGHGPTPSKPTPVSWHPPSHSDWHPHDGWHGHEGWHFHGGWQAHNGWHPDGGWGHHASNLRSGPWMWRGGSHGTYAWHHRARDGGFAALRRDIARHGGRVVVTWARFVYHPGGNGHSQHAMHASGGHSSSGHGYAWSKSGHASSGHWSHAGSPTHTASW